MKTPQTPHGKPKTAMPAGHDTRHAACGATWKQRGNQTSHCAGCHHTFEGLTVFDTHRTTTENGNRTCLPPEKITIQGRPLEKVNGTWRVAYTPEEKAATAARLRKLTKKDTK